MLSIRFQRTGRKGHAQFRIVVQDSRLTPTSGKVVARIGSYNPHTKITTLDKEKAQFYLDNGAQPSDRVIRMFKSEGLKLPVWVKDSASKERAVRDPEKRRSTTPVEDVKPEEVSEAPAEEATKEAPSEETEETNEEAKKEEAPAEENGSEASTEEPKEAPSEETEETKKDTDK